MAAASSKPIAFSCSCRRKASRVRRAWVSPRPASSGSRSTQPRKTPGAGSLPATQVVVPSRTRRRVHRQEERRRGRIRPGWYGRSRSCAEDSERLLRGTAPRRDRPVSGLLSPVFFALGARCRFHPNCSTYAAECVRHYGRRAAAGARSNGSVAAIRSTLAGTIRRFHRTLSMDTRVAHGHGGLDGPGARLDHLLRQTKTGDKPAPQAQV